MKVGFAGLPKGKRPAPMTREEARRLARRNLEEITAEEDAEITAAALADPDAQPSEDLMRRKRGRPFADTHKEKVSLRLDPEVVAHFRATGSGWQTRVNDVLRKAAGLK
jgi:uncharacterized protein (DUF4415 family)